MRRHPLKITVFGTGAMGSFFSARLTHLQHKINPSFTVQMFGQWQEQIDAVSRTGLQLTEKDGTSSIIRLAATNQLKKIENTDIALICVKSYQTPKITPQLVQILSKTGLAISLQNGLGNKAPLVRQLGKKRVVQGLTTQGATLLRPGYLQHAGGGDTICEDNPTNSALLDELLQHLNSSGIPSFSTLDFKRPFWQKLIVNAAINPVTALLHLKNGELLNSPVLLNLLKLIVSECIVVARTQDLHFEESELLEKTISVCKTTAQNNSSMLQDVLNRRPTEIDAINGAIVRHAKQSGIATPINTKLTELLVNTDELPLSIELLESTLLNLQTGN
ncbi:MAG: 2-dehydropantoate 2-reductase [Calditrichaeota bacterium]|nr:MAG: 2-dehydropantoate 2-reductase [Calditrichota bacterium]